VKRRGVIRVAALGDHLSSLICDVHPNPGSTLTYLTKKPPL
jgi:hypothetical protein